MISIKQRRAYTEVLAVLEELKLTDSIPGNLLKIMRKEKDESWTFIFNKNIPLEKQLLSKSGAEMLSIIYLAYICNNIDEKNKLKKIYEDNALGKLSDERFKKISSSYENEQKELKERINELRKIIDDLSVKVISTESFVKAVKKYTRAKKLTPRMLNELVDHIEVYHAEKINGVKTQRITIYYTCIGAIDIPDDISIAMPRISLHTREGVSISYQANAT